ncbi:TIGR03086 family metal-binding protein [Kitasatospora sp. NPDC006697]|uniref:TIGR03086 family metal-binding protein n=1 Tax=Kitasatospora sp. NPDC006697 TaxID=3364020 RepID=UPI003683F82F
MDIRALHTQALALVTELVDQVKEDQLALPTPCADWDLRTLLGHMIGQNYGFAAAAEGRGEDGEAWRDRTFEGAPAQAWAASAAELGAAFAATAGPFRIPEIREGVDIPADMAISFHFIDTLVHGWDLAAALGLPFEPPAELAQVGLVVAEQVPAGPEFRGPGRAFSEVLELEEEQPAAFHRTLALLGRDRNWTAAA